MGWGDAEKTGWWCSSTARLLAHTLASEHIVRGKLPPASVAQCLDKGLSMPCFCSKDLHSKWQPYALGHQIHPNPEVRNRTPLFLLVLGNITSKGVAGLPCGHRSYNSDTERRQRRICLCPFCQLKMTILNGTSTSLSMTMSRDKNCFSQDKLWGPCLPIPKEKWLFLFLFTVDLSLRKKNQTNSRRLQQLGSVLQGLLVNSGPASSSRWCHGARWLSQRCATGEGGRKLRLSNEFSFRS